MEKHHLSLLFIKKLARIRTHEKQDSTQWDIVLPFSSLKGTFLCFFAAKANPHQQVSYKHRGIRGIGPRLFVRKIGDIAVVFCAASSSGPSRSLSIQKRPCAKAYHKASQRDGSPLSGVTISVHAHPEYGTTLSRADGRFDLAVNGGGQLTIEYLIRTCFFRKEA